MLFSQAFIYAHCPFCDFLHCQLSHKQNSLHFFYFCMLENILVRKKATKLKSSPHILRSSSGKLLSNPKHFTIFTSTSQDQNELQNTSTYNRLQILWPSTFFYRNSFSIRNAIIMFINNFPHFMAWILDKLNVHDLSCFPHCEDFKFKCMWVKE